MQSTEPKVARWTCPACTFRIYNRGCKRCERCGAALPVELLYSDEQLRELRAREERQLLEDGTRRRGRAMPRRDPSTGSAPGFFADAFTDRSGGDAPFTSGGDGVFDGGGAAGSFGGDGGDGGS